MRALLLILLLLATPVAAQEPPRVTAQPTPHGLVVTWQAPEVVCPWLEHGALQVYAGGALPCRASGVALVTLIPDSGARVVLRTPEGVEVASTGVGWVLALPVVVVR